LAARTSFKIQAWRSATAQINGVPATTMTNVPLVVSLNAPGLDLSQASIVWEARDQEPFMGQSWTFTPTNYGAQWVEAEASWPDGRRVFARGGFFATNTLPTVQVTVTMAEASEEGPKPGQFTIIRSGYTNAPLTVNYQLGGTAEKFTDYRRPQGDMPEFVVIPAGAFSASITIVPVDDSVFEGFETATLTISSNANYNVGAPDRATVTIADNELGILGITTSIAGDAAISWASVPGRAYRVVSKDDYEDSNWQDLSADIVATGHATTWIDVGSQSQPQRYYRIRKLP